MGAGMRVPRRGFNKTGDEAYLCPEDNDKGPLGREKWLMKHHSGDEVLRGNKG